MSTKKRKKKENLALELLIILSVIFLFMTAACINKWAVFQEHVVAYAVTLIADMAILICWLWNITGKMLRYKERGVTLKTFWGQNCGVMIAMFFSLASRAVQFGDMPRWDAWTYYNILQNACQNFDFTLQSFVQNYTMASHPTLGFAGITAIGVFLNDGGYTGVLVVWMIVTLLTTFCLYYILKKILPTCSWVYHTIATCTVMSTPLVLGTFSYYQPDAGAVCFFVFIVYCYLYRKNLLMFFSMMLLLMTKEIGIVILAGFGIGALLGRMIYTGKEKTVWKRFLNFFKEPLGISGILAALAVGIYMLFFIKSGGAIWSLSISDDAAFSTFTFRPSFILYKCKQFFVLNFNWLIWGGNLAFFIVGKIRKKGKKCKNKLKRQDILLIFFLAAVFQIVFYSSYITFTNPRYHVLIDYCGVFLFVAQAAPCLTKKKLYYGMVGITGILLFVEAYVTIDPISLLAFENNDTGNARIINEGYHSSIVQGDYCIYNHQFSYLGKAYNHILRDVGYHEGMDVLVWEGSYNYSIDRGYYWDTEGQNLVLVPSENTIPIRLLEQESITRDGEKLQREAVFVLVPQFGIVEEYAERFLGRYYEIRYKGSVEISCGGVVTFYVCDLTNMEMLME